MTLPLKTLKSSTSICHLFVTSSSPQQRQPPKSLLMILAKTFGFNVFLLVTGAGLEPARSQ
jgi:hypothetical protein